MTERSKWENKGRGGDTEKAKLNILVLCVVGSITVCLFLMSGCAMIRMSSRSEVGKSALLQDIELCAQKENDCGATSLFMVMQYLGSEVPLDEVRAEVFQSFRDSNLSIDMMTFPKHYGFGVRALSGQISDLKSSLDSGIPPIVCIEQNLPWSPFRNIQRDISEGSRPLLWLFAGSSLGESSVQKQGHFLVVVGYDDGSRILYYCDSQGRVAGMSYRKFLNQWGKTDSFLLLLEPLRGKEAVGK